MFKRKRLLYPWESAEWFADYFAVIAIFLQTLMVLSWFETESPERSSYYFAIGCILGHSIYFKWRHIGAAIAMISWIYLILNQPKLTTDLYYAWFYAVPCLQVLAVILKTWVRMKKKNFGNWKSFIDN